MRTDRIGPPSDGGSLGAAIVEPTHPGRIQVRERALRKVSAEASATAVGVERGDVSIDVTEYRGGLAVRLATPMPIPDLDDTAAIEAGEPVLQRVGRLQEQLRARIAHLTGREVTRIDITITGAAVPQSKRVR